MNKKELFANGLISIITILFVIITPLRQIWVGDNVKSASWLYIVFWIILLISVVINYSVYGNNLNPLWFLYLLFALLIFLLAMFGDHKAFIGTIITIILLITFYMKVPIEEFKNSSNIERIVHGIVLFVTFLMIYLYSNYPQPKMKGFVLIVLVLFLNTIAILYGSRNTGIAPGQKLARVFKWFIYISIISTIVWYSTYGTIGNYTTENVEDILDWRQSISQTPDTFAYPKDYSLNDIISYLIQDDSTDDITPDERKEIITERGEASQEEERREISEDYYD